jgi:hypothetical protein
MIRAALEVIDRWLSEPADARRRRLEQAVECLPYDGRDRDRVEVYAGYGLPDTARYAGRV